MTIANALSLLRIALAPIMLGLAWEDALTAFVACLALALATDIADGKIARALGQTSARGAQLDSWGDLGLYVVVPIAAVWLRPELVRSERAWFVLAVASAFVPVAVGLVRFVRPTSYHTRATKLAAYLLGAAVLAAFAFAWVVPFRVAALVLAASQLEEIVITLTLPAWRADVRSLAEARAIRRDARGAGGAR
jgi:CDP-diacylglycerol--glycerol-3-phosphate 3-phosphatidyltransferase